MGLQWTLNRAATACSTAATGRRVRKRNGGLLARSDNQKIVPAILCPVYPNPQNVVTSYYFNDAQGNVTALVSPSGMILAQYEYDPFGNLISTGGLMATAMVSLNWDERSKKP